MNKEINYETFLFVGSKKFIIYVNQKDTLKTIHKNEINFSDELDMFQFQELANFLDQKFFI